MCAERTFINRAKQRYNNLTASIIMNMQKLEVLLLKFWNKIFHFSTNTITENLASTIMEKKAKSKRFK